VSNELIKNKEERTRPPEVAVITAGEFRLHLSVLIPNEWRGRIFIDYTTIETLLN